MRLAGSSNLSALVPTQHGPPGMASAGAFTGSRLRPESRAVLAVFLLGSSSQMSWGWAGGTGVGFIVAALLGTAVTQAPWLPC